MNDWPYEDPPNVAVLTTKAVLEGGLIFQVSRDDEDGMWQFHTTDGNDNLSEEDARLVSLQLVWQTYPSVSEVADLKPGWVAWREGVGKPWRRTRNASPPAGPGGRGGAVAALKGWVSGGCGS